MKVFEKLGPVNTEETLQIAITRAKETDAELVIATTTGASALKALEIAKDLGYLLPPVFVTHTYGSRKPGENPMSEETRAKLSKGNCRLVTATHLLSGAERGLSKKYQGIYPVELIADTLRAISRGTKVCVECSAMALDAGAIRYGKPIVAVGGSGSGCDTAVVLTPSHGNNILDFKIHEFLCMPW